VIDILFVAWNRLEFTRESLKTLVANTDWSLVRRLIIHDDGSTDGTREYVTNDYGNLVGPRQVRVFHGQIGSPTSVMNSYLREREPEVTFLAKIDNDAMMPPGWLNDALYVMERSPELGFLGLGAWMPVGDGPRTYELCKAVGGICLMRTRAFDCCLPWAGGRWGGSQMWQSDHMTAPIVITGPEREERLPHRLSVSGWINPGIPVFLLDQVPFEPWISLSKQYILNGWQRSWPIYPETETHLWDWWPWWGHEYVRQCADA
jgi:glycosyltransferase involved in cell wall biosynthesis